MTARASVLALLLAAAAPAWAGDLSAEKERELRAALLEIVSEASPAARRALVAKASAGVGDAPIADVVAAVRRGPLRPPGAPKPRRVGGRLESLTTVGNVGVGYSFEHAGHVYRYAVDVPRSYDPQTPVGLLVDPGHGSGRHGGDVEKAGFLEMWRGFADRAGHREWLVARTEIVEQVGVDGARKPLPEDEACEVFDAFFRDLFSRFAVDPDRVYASGISQTGFWTWVLGVSRPDRFDGIAPMSAISAIVDGEAANLLATPAYVLHGDADPTCAIASPRATCARLQRIGVEHRFVQIAGGKHDVGVWSNLPPGLAWLGQEPRARYPARISKSVRNLRGPWCWWVRLDAIEREGTGEAGDPPTAGVDAEREGQTIRLHTDGVSALTVCLSSDMVDLTQPVEIVWNGTSVHRAVVTASAETLLGLAGERCDWAATFEAAVSLRR